MESGKLGPVESVELKLLVPHPANARGKIKDADVAELAMSISKVGVLDALIVRGENPETKELKNEILSGHRRARAAAVAGLDVVPCRLLDCDDEEALRILVLANHDREDPDLFREADAVAGLEAKGWTVKDAADLLGKSPRFVATLLAVSKIEPTVRKAMQAEKCDWTPAMVEEFAKIAPEAQPAAWKDLRNEDLEELRAYSRNRLLVLGTAPWDLQDAGLVPAAGSCAACPKTSLRAPGLFDDGDLDPADPAALKKANCRDLVCWTLKLRAKLAADVAQLEKETGKRPALISDSYGAEQKELGKLGEVVHSYDVQKAKKGQKGSVPAIDVRSGKTSWIKTIKRNAYGQPAKKKQKPAGKPKPPTTKERLERLFARRNAWIVDHVREEVVQKLAKPEEHTLSVEILVAIFGGRENYGFDGDVKTGGLRKVVEGIGGIGERAIAVFERVKKPLCQFLTRVNLDQVARQVDDAYVVADLFGFDRPYLTKAAEEGIPTPKGLLKEVGDAIAAPPAKPKPEKKPKAAKKKQAVATE